MNNDKQNFRHESMQDKDTIADLLLSLQQGLNKGTLSFSDADNAVTLKPAGLLNLTIKASDSDGQNVLDVRISWQSDNADRVNNKLRVSTEES